jgi:glutamate synthase (NADPH/NADH) large chain
MSGGVAYVLDLQKGLVNTDMVGLGPVDGFEGEELRELVERHAEETDSPVAHDLLTDWSASLARFTRVLPIDYQRVLDAKAAAERDGRDVITAIMEAAHG